MSKMCRKQRKIRSMPRKKPAKAWHPKAYATILLNKNEQIYSINELELVAVVWSLEHFKYYPFGSQLTLQTNNQALLSALKKSVATKPINTD